MGKNLVVFVLTMASVHKGRPQVDVLGVFESYSAADNERRKFFVSYDWSAVDHFSDPDLPHKGHNGGRIWMWTKDTIWMMITEDIMD